MPATTVRFCGNASPFVTGFVPAAVPSDIQTSWSCGESAAVKKSEPAKSVSCPTPPPSLPGRMSLTSLVPAVVPSVLQSSLPCVPSLAAKKIVPAASVKSRGNEFGTPGRTSLTSLVPAAVPFDLQGSVPCCFPSFAEK